MQMHHGMFHWNELMTRDVDGAKGFYAETLGWSFDAFPMENGTYWVAVSDGKPVGGIMDLEGIAPPETPPHWFSYIQVDDIDARVAKVATAGGQVLREPFDVPQVGRIAIILDKSGAPVGWITPAPQEAAPA